MLEESAAYARHGVRCGLRKKYAAPEELLREDGAAGDFFVAGVDRRDVHPDPLDLNKGIVPSVPGFAPL
jgi:hypothetical protein